jgi:exonuclease III
LEIPEACVPRLREVQVGSFEEWGAESDHCPVTVSLDV